jgi:hypothetical protein
MPPPNCKHWGGDNRLRFVRPDDDQVKGQVQSAFNPSALVSSIIDDDGNAPDYPKVKGQMLSSFTSSALVSPPIDAAPVIDVATD